jgi:hypothetical protein
MLQLLLFQQDIQQDAIDFDDLLNVKNTKGNDINVASDPENKVIFQIIADKYL